MAHGDITRTIVDAATAELLKEPGGLRFSELVRRVMSAKPELAPATVGGTLTRLDQRMEGIRKISRGFYRHVDYIQPGDSPGAAQLGGDGAADSVVESPTGPSESQFYEGFAERLVSDLEEATKAIPLGGNAFGGKWGTPDVIGILKPKDVDYIKFHAEIVTAEVKTDKKQIVTAFGQACSYGLFSHKVYLVVPDLADEDMDRINALCLVYGVGLVTYDPANPKEPRFSARIRARKREPDMYYVNEKVRMVAVDLLD